MSAADLSVQHDLGHAVHVRHAGHALLTYVHRPGDVQLESPRPYLHPVHTLGGELVTLLRPHDHVWHKGIAWSLPVVGAHNFWGGPTDVRDEGYVQLANNGSQDHVAFTDLHVDAAGVVIAHDLTWRTQAGAAAVEECRRLTVTVPGGPAGTDGHQAWVLTFESRMRNVSGDALDLGSPTTRGRENAGYGGLFWRGPRSFTGGTLLAPDLAGGEELRGTRAPWAGFSGRSDGSAAGSTLVMVDGAGNPHHPPQWFARTEWFAGLNPAPFFSAEVPFGPGEDLLFRYAVVVADGASDAERAAGLAGLGGAALAALAAPR